MNISELTDKQIAILEIAEQLFSEKGYEASSVRELSKRAGINIAMINYYFGSKEKLLETLFLYKTNHFKLSLESVLNNNTFSNTEKLILLAETYTDRVFQNPNFHKIMLKEVDSESPFVYSLLKDVKLRNRTLIDKVIQSGIKSGEFFPDMTVEKVMSIVFGLLSHFLLNEKFYLELWALEQSEAGLKEFKTNLKNQILFSIKAIIKYNENA